jgi:hypothetical protein
MINSSINRRMLYGDGRRYMLTVSEKKCTKKKRREKKTIIVEGDVPLSPSAYSCTTSRFIVCTTNYI